MAPKSLLPVQRDIQLQRNLRFELAPMGLTEPPPRSRSPERRDSHAKEARKKPRAESLAGLERLPHAIEAERGSSADGAALDAAAAAAARAAADAKAEADAKAKAEAVAWAKAQEARQLGLDEDHFEFLEVLWHELAGI